MSVSHDERTALADLLTSVGPDAPTLCEGWTTGDLAVHLVVREYRPDAAAGMFLGPARSRLDAVTQEYSGRPFADLVAAYRGGPPVWNPMRWIDPVVNLAENFIHHEDVRRGGGEWSARSLSERTRNALWRAARLAARGFLVPTGPTVRLVRTDGAGGAVEVGKGAPEVTVAGAAPEILLWLYGRDKACDLTVTGPVETVVRRQL